MDLLVAQSFNKATQRIRLLLACSASVILIVLAACGGDDHSDETSPSPLGKQLLCDETLKAEFRPDNQTQVLLVRQFKKGDTLLSPPSDMEAQVNSDLCLVKLLVGPGHPGPAGAPSTSAGIGIEVWLPAKEVWNGRVHALGGGGWAGTEESDISRISSATLSADFRSAPTVAAQEAAVTSSTDTGHAGGSLDPSFAMNPDGSINTTLWTDFASRGIHEQVKKTKALATAYYGIAPRRTYWDGGSTGGRQALMQAQKYPEDFDGIISGYPAIHWSRFITAELYPQIVIQRDLGGIPMTAAQLDLVSNAAIAACDRVGVVHLGYILDPASCHYDPTQDPAVLCVGQGGSNTTAACVTPVQANAINKIWYGMTSNGSVPDPVTDNGWTTLTGVHRWYGLARGTSLLGLASNAPFSIAADQVALELQDPALGSPMLRNATGNGTDRWARLTYAELSNAFDKGLALQAAFGNINTDNPDLSAFKARGGRIIQYHGHADPLIFPQGSANYYERVAVQMGGLENVQAFYRLYFVPGMGHGPGNGTSNPDANPPYPAQGQIYGLLIDWVERGIAPDAVTIRSPASTLLPARSQPMCVYPKKAVHAAGDPFVAASYVCA